MTGTNDFPTSANILESIPGAVFRARRNYPRFTTRFISDGGLETLGYAPGEIMQDEPFAFLDIVHPDDIAAFCEELNATLMLPPPDTKPIDHTLRIIHKDGSVRWIWFHAKISAYREDDPDASEIEGAILDMTEWMTSKNQQLTQFAREDFVSRLSRSIRTPVSSIKGLGALLMETPLDILQQNYVDNIVESADDLLDVLSAITGLSLIESDRLEIRKHDFSPRELALELHDTFARKAERRGILLEFTADDDVPAFVSGDSGCLKEILINLIDTSIKHAHDGAIRVACSVDKERSREHEEERIVLTFRISGDAAPLAREEADDVDASHYGTKAIGLSVSKKLLRLMQGEIGTSSTDATGATYYFSAPFAPATATKPREARIDLRIPSLKILLVEDSPINQLVTNDILVNMGHEVEIAENGFDALTCLQSQDFDVVLMDCIIPGIDGYEATRRIRSGEADVRNPEIPVVAITANAMMGDRQKCIDAGMDDYISKPVNPEQIKRTLSKWSPHMM